MTSSKNENILPLINANRHEYLKKSVKSVAKKSGAEMNFELGDKFSYCFTVSEDVYRGFGNLFLDRNPLHSDREYAQTKGFKDCVMYGNILNGFLSYFIGEMLPLKNVIIHSQEINYKKPVYLNDKLTLEAIVSDVHYSVGAIEFKYNFKNQADIVVAKGKIQIGILK